MVGGVRVQQGGLYFEARNIDPLTTFRGMGERAETPKILIVSLTCGTTNAMWCS